MTDTSNQSKIILSLCDYSGEWIKPYVQAGYTCKQIDLKLGDDVRTLPFQGQVHGILAAPPCTAFAGSGAQYWPDKDADGRTLEGLAIVDACLRVVAMSNASWWALENPVGRLKRWLGSPRLIFQPYEFGDAYTKRTCLWGRFNENLPKTIVSPERVCNQGSWVQRLGGKSERTKELRSVTPQGFANAFFKANP
jgi:hypothetical protein